MNIVRELDAISPLWGAVVAEDMIAVTLAFPYEPNDRPVDPFYFASHNLYMRCLELKRRLVAEGVGVYKVNQPYRHYALASGVISFVGKNGLGYTDKYGSYVALECFGLRSEDISPKLLTASTQSLCQDCTICTQNCPTSAISSSGCDTTICLRNYMSKGVIESDTVAAQMSTRLFGCNICQRVCPMNNATGQGTDPFPDISTLITDKASKWADYVGSNFARDKILKNLAIVYAGNNGLTEHLRVIKKLVNDEEYRINANRAINQLLDKKRKKSSK